MQENLYEHQDEDIFLWFFLLSKRFVENVIFLLIGLNGKCNLNDSNLFGNLMEDHDVIYRFLT
jgi:hypothetical protein